MKLFYLFLVFISIQDFNAQKLLEAHFEKFEDNSWVKDIRVSHTYDDSDRIISTVRERWTNGERWTFINRMDFKRNDFGRTTNYKVYWWDKNDSAWESRRSVDYLYDSDSLLTEIVFSVFRNETIELNAHQLFSYNDSNLLTDKIKQTLNSETGLWENQLKNNVVYDKSGKKVFETQFKWSNETNLWIAIKKTTYKYNDHQMLKQALFQKWLNDDWTNHHLRTRHYDSNLEELSSDREYWNDSLDVWEKSDKSNSVYTEYGRTKSRLSYSWNEGKLSWDKLQRATYIYESTSLADVPEASEREESGKEISVFPNPTSEILKISNAPKGEYFVINAYGKTLMVYNNIEEQNIEFDVSRFQVGVYFLFHENTELIKFVKI